MTSISHLVTTSQEDKLLDTSISPLVQIIDGVARADSRLIARELDIQHHKLLELISKYQADFEEFGHLTFKRETVTNSVGATNQKKFALLNEDQSYLAVTYVKNTQLARGLKVRLVKEFKLARELAQPKSIEDLIILSAQGIKSARLEAEQAKQIALEVKQDVVQLEHKQDSLENSLCIDGIERGQLKEIVDSIALTSPALHWRNVWTVFNKRFGLASYSTLPKKRFLEAKEFLQLWLENEQITNTLPDQRGLFDG